MQNLQRSWDVSFPAARAKYLVLNLKFEVVLLHFLRNGFYGRLFARSRASNARLIALNMENL